MNSRPTVVAEGLQRGVLVGVLVGGVEAVVVDVVQPRQTRPCAFSFSEAAARLQRWRRAPEEHCPCSLPGPCAGGAWLLAPLRAGVHWPATGVTPRRARLVPKAPVEAVWGGRDPRLE